MVEDCTKSGGYHFETCYATYTADQLTVGNNWIERTWIIKNGLLYTSSILHKSTGMQWVCKIAPNAIVPDMEMTVENRKVHVVIHTGKLSPVSEEGLQVELTSGDHSDAIHYHIQIFPNSSAVIMRVDHTGSISNIQLDLSTEEDEPQPDGIELKDQPPPKAASLGYMDSIELKPLHLKLRQVEFWDQTDRHNELVFEKEWLLHPNESHKLKGNLFVLEDPTTKDGIVFIKHAPLPTVRPEPNPSDFEVHTGGFSFMKKEGDPDFGPQHPRYPLAYRCSLLGHGTGDKDGQGYPYASLTYSGGLTGMIIAIQGYQRQWRKLDDERDIRFITNTWGDRSRDAKINEPFLKMEVESAARLGVEVVQIDDGWQNGKTANSIHQGGVWEGFWKNNNRFWEVNPQKFPNGLQPLLDLAKLKDIKIGLWFAPDSSNDFENWRRDVERILELFRMGVCYFKIDGVKARTKKAEHHLQRFFDTALEESNGQIVFDLDVTAEIRPGYWGMPHTGPLFIENRYTDFHRYWPHQTLRNLWKLAHYVDPARIRMEFLNNARNRELYMQDPLAPSAYSPDYLFATTMFSNPLGWFEVSGLPAVYYEQAALLVQCWKQHRSRIFSGTIIPIGEVPDGTSWTGFLTMSERRSHGYILIFREYNQNSVSRISLPFALNGKANCNILYGNGRLEIAEQTLLAEIPKPQDFIFAEYGVMA